MLRPGGRHIGDGRGLGHADPQHATGGTDGPGPHADENAGGTGPHQVQARVVRGTTPHDDRRRRQLADELLEVERRPALVTRDVLGGDDRALDDEDVETRFQRHLVVGADLLRGQRGGGDDAMGLDLLNPAGDQLGLDGLAVHVLHLARGDVRREGGDPLELGVGVLVAAVDAFEVEHGETAELADQAGAVRRDDAVQSGRQQRQFEAVGAERPRDVDVIGIACTT